MCLASERGRDVGAGVGENRSGPDRGGCGHAGGSVVDGAELPPRLPVLAEALEQVGMEAPGTSA